MVSLKAYVVTDEFGEGYAAVMFAEKSVVARREGANELDCEFGDVSCKRAPWADDLAPGPVSPKDCIELGGFWYECGCGCGRRINDEGGQHDYELDGDNGELNPMDPVYDDTRRVFWNRMCKDNDDRAAQERKDKAARDQSDAEAAVLAKWPFATDIHAYRGYDGTAGGTYDVLHASFRFPGGEWPVSWAIGAETINVPRGEVDAWNALTKTGAAA